MNRQMKRMMRRQGQLAPDGTPATAQQRRQPPRPAVRTGPRERRSALGWVREVRGELRKVAWPTRSEVANLSIIVFITLVILIGLIFVLDLGFAKGVLYIFET